MKRKTLALVICFIVVLCFAGTGFAENLTPQLCKSKVIAAAKLIEKNGDKALDAIKDPNGEFRFGGGAGYVWIHNLDGIMVMHPIKPTLNGKGILEIRDVNGVYLFVSFNECVEENGAGWVPYAWPKPGQQESSPKVSYVKLAKRGSKDYVVGSGMYDVTAKDIKKQFPDDPIYEE